MMIHGLGFLSLSASVVLPWALVGVVQGQKITESLVTGIRQSSVTNVRQSSFTDDRQLSTVQEKKLPKRTLISAIGGTTFYVSGSGNDRNSGLSPSSAFRTPQRAANLTKPGDTVLLMNGVYKNSNSGAVLTITRSGSSNGWIAYKAYPGHSPKIEFDGWHGVWIKDGASYIEVKGIEIEGNNERISLGYAMSQRYNVSNARTSGNCLTIDGRSKRHPHHIRILNNEIRDCGGGGIIGIQTDYVTVDGNDVYNNAWYSPFGGSGISFLKNWSYDGNQGYRMFITRNRVYNNKMLVPWINTGKKQDGNGIILDRLAETGYRGRTLIANNLVYRNGGGGIHAFKSNNIDIIHNTSYYNSQTPEIEYGQISMNNTSNVRVLNNILVSQSGQQIYMNSRKNSNTVFNYNLYNTLLGASGKGPNDIVADPQFVNAGSNFRLRSSSPAINSGMRFDPVTSDFAGSSRAKGSKPDRGAYEI
ncbi:MAG: right-handed parallel beta-helix repeat-containing protein [Nostoc sp. ChiSLP02]|nr:right-handed parallel beta-helix repeat-containing protein [Nostoc sp. DedSLP05]MDZ8101097.1 right-handed parallel beta-helix repeat-containing protein [Nostoc sp. DedSLP01]MDZ8187875.1 right-handed parallel beta-helix repeat-containing protein [Nostoc sp. ChiSLP02]